jgi:hypothetical protein
MDDERRLRVLLVLKHAGYIGVYAPLVEELAERGHSVHVACVGADREGEATLKRLSAHPRIAYGGAPQRAPLDGWASVAWLARALGDLARYSHPRFAQAPALRNRTANKVETHLQSAAGFDPLTRRLALRRARQLRARTDAELSEQAIRRSGRLETGIPISRRVTAFVREQEPDVVLVSPLVDLASSLLEYLKAARHLRISTGICVASWDNLSSKGLLRFVPERVFVWNETQRQEAVELHGIPADRVVATGAARFDDWFAQRPSSPREEFLRRLGLDPGHPYVLYLCSSGFIVRDEAASVSRWIEALRGAEDERLRGIGVVVRPHPKRHKPWKGVDLSGFGNATVWPRLGSDSAPAEGRADFYDSIAHSAAVVGVNTSAMIEAAIVGKSVYTWLAPEFAQEGTIHFHYLLHENGGFLHVAGTQDEHLAQLARGLSHESEEADRTRRFVESFVRPGGLARSATAVYADAVEELAGLLPTEEGKVRAGIGFRLALAPVAFASSLALAATIGKAAARSRLPGGRKAARQRPRVGTARA